ncbi:MAG: NACHT domain-containing protein, partial [Myxococcota bacterium]
MKRFSNHKQRSGNISRWIPWAVVLSLGLGCTGSLDKIGGEINPKSKKYHPSRYTQNVTEKAAAGELPAIIGREGELLSMMAGLATGNVILLGGTGAGKTALVHKLAQQIAGGRAGEFNDRTVVLIDLSRLKDLLDEKDLTPQRVLQFLELAMEHWRQERGDQTLFVVDELQTIVADGDTRFSNALKAFLDKHRG